MAEKLHSVAGKWSMYRNQYLRLDGAPAGSRGNRCFNSPYHPRSGRVCSFKSCDRKGLEALSFRERRIENEATALRNEAFPDSDRLARQVVQMRG